MMPAAKKPSAAKSKPATKPAAKAKAGARPSAKSKPPAKPSAKPKSAASPAKNRRTMQFQTEARQLLGLVTNALYSNSEIFLRELVSNAADACDRLRFAALDDPSLSGDEPLCIRLAVDASARTIEVRDNGIGMNRQEIQDNLGTIARSGTARFLESLSGDARRDARLIGQFGVGFYSAFIVAHRVEVLSCRGGGEAAVRWTSDGGGSYEVEDAQMEGRGTRVLLHIKDDADEYLAPARLRSIVHKYAEHIQVPVQMREGDAWRQTNSGTALWARPARELQDADYHSFYTQLCRDPQPPLCWAHNRVEGKMEYTSLLFVPRSAPADLYQQDMSWGLKLYVQRTFIMDGAEQFLPRYLRFVRGVLDSNDLPLNVSREILQQSEAVAQLRSALVRRVLDCLGRLADNAEDYARFWSALGRVLKEGPVEDADNRERIVPLLRFASTAGDGLRSLADYKAAMGDGQGEIYYVLAESPELARNSPHLEALEARGIEVLLLCDPVDEWLMNSLGSFDGMRLRDISRGAMPEPSAADGTAATADNADGDKAGRADKVGAADKGADGTTSELPGGLAGRMEGLLGERISKVQGSSRLVDSPACLVLGDGDLSENMRRVVQASGGQAPAARPVLEINAGHPLIKRLAAEQDEQRFADLALVIMDQATLAGGGQIPAPGDFVARINRILQEQGN